MRTTTPIFCACISFAQDQKPAYIIQYPLTLGTNANDKQRENPVCSARAQENPAATLQRFGVEELALFGSFACDQANEDSEIDILVHLDKPATFDSYFGVQFYLEDLLSRSVNLVTDKALRQERRPRVEKEAIRV